MNEITLCSKQKERRREEKINEEKIDREEMIYSNNKESVMPQISLYSTKKLNAK